MAAAAAAETSLTHRHPEALATAAMVALLARQMIQGKTLQAACEGILLEFSVSSQTGLTKNILKSSCGDLWRFPETSGQEFFGKCKIIASVFQGLKYMS